MKVSRKNENVSLPKATFQKMVGAMNAVEDAKEHLEDFLMLSNKKVVSELERARLDHLKGRVGNWQTLKARYGVSSHSHRDI
ncbi:MAG: hypothetical protein Q7R93_04125 [bacterium]|nr:hypothetical protein [bacterium]